MELPFAVKGSSIWGAVRLSISGASSADDGAKLASPPRRPDIGFHQKEDIGCWLLSDPFEEQEINDDFWVGSSYEAIEPNSLLRKGGTDPLVTLLSGSDCLDWHSGLAVLCEKANEETSVALEAKKGGDLMAALAAHSRSARLLNDIALRIRENDSSFAHLLLMQSQAQAKQALILSQSLKKVRAMHHRTSSSFHREKIRELINGAMEIREETDISESTFLGKAGSEATGSPRREGAVLEAETNDGSPIRRMLELEHELSDMDTFDRLKPKLGSSDTSCLGCSFVLVPQKLESSRTVAQGAPFGPRDKSRCAPTSLATAMRRRMAIDINPEKITGHDDSFGFEHVSRHSSCFDGGRSQSAVALPCIQERQGAAWMSKLQACVTQLQDENALLLLEIERAVEMKREADNAKEKMKRFDRKYLQRARHLQAYLEKYRDTTKRDPRGFVSKRQQILDQERLVHKLELDLNSEREKNEQQSVKISQYQVFCQKVVQASNAQKARSALRLGRNSAHKVGCEAGL